MNEKLIQIIDDGYTSSIIKVWGYTFMGKTYTYTTVHYRSFEKEI